MSWLKRVTGMQKLIDLQENTNSLLSGILTEMVQLNTPKPNPKGPRTKN